METNKPQNHLATNNITTEEYIYILLSWYLLKGQVFKTKFLHYNFTISFKKYKEVMVKWQD